MPARAHSRLLLRTIGRGALMPVAALAVHQLRFLLAYGGGAPAALERQGHAYLSSLAPWIVLAIAAAAGAFMWSLGRAVAGHRTAARYTASLVALWLTCAALLIAIYATQELLEGWFATGHAAGLEGIFGYGGWWAVPAALCVGLVLAGIFHGARWVLDEVAARRTRLPRRAQHASGHAARPTLDVLPPRLAPIAAGASTRGPPC